MRQPFFIVLAICTNLLTANTASAQSQEAYASVLKGPPVQLSASAPTVEAPAPGAAVAEAPATVVLTGHVKSAVGILPGAVIKIANSKEMVVTDADGSFHVTVPAGSGAVQATASYAGFADEAIVLDGNSDEVSMKTAQPVASNKSQSLKNYQKTARKQAKRSVRKVRKANK